MSAQVPSPQTLHWADTAAQKILREKGDKAIYTVASGITPSGMVHFGNFREVITVDLVARALISLGKKVRFIFSWDDFDTFRKIPMNMPKQEMLKEYLFHPIVDTPDPFDKDESYAAHHEKNFEAELKHVGVSAEFLYQAKKYRSGTYRGEILKTLKARDTLAKILDDYRQEKLGNDWWPISVYCEKCNRDKTNQLHFDGNHTLTYHCELCAHKGKEDLNTSSRVKLPWRMDWPMRWAFEQVDFEPGGKDHSSDGGSYTTAKTIVKEVYGTTPPVYLQYDFVSFKGMGGKMSSSKGNLVTLTDVLKVYTPEMVRWIFAGQKPNVDFSIGFDLDVIKNYEDFDRFERQAFGVDVVGEAKRALAKRVYELSVVGSVPSTCPIQPSFRHLTNILQIHGLSLTACRQHYQEEFGDVMNLPQNVKRFEERAACALQWLENHAPEDFTFSVNTELQSVELNPKQKAFVLDLRREFEASWEKYPTDKELHEKIYEIMKGHDLAPAEAFEGLYELLISKKKGPKLASFLLTIGKERALKLLPKS